MGGGIPAQRIATHDDADRINELMRASVLDLFPRFYDQRQTASAAEHIAHLDTALLDDGTYFVHEVDGEIVACGGWSRRGRLYTGSGAREGDDRLLDPATEAAHVRAMFVRADWTRRGLGRAILESVRTAARAEGFRMLDLMATLPGVPLYRALGFRDVQRTVLAMPDGVTIDAIEMSRPIDLEEAATCDDVAAALQRLAPALDRYVNSHPQAGVGAYVPGTIPSEAMPLPEVGIGIDATIDELGLVVERGSRISAPGFLGFITTGATTVDVAAHAAVGVAGGQRYLLHSFNALEWTGLRWLADLCGLPPGVAGVFTSGGSTANLVALGAARQAAYERLGIDVAEDGLPRGAPPGQIYASARSHRTVHRAAGVLGLGRSGVIDIPCDRGGHIDVEALANALDDGMSRGIVPVAVVAAAGTTDTGSVDRIGEVVDVARNHGCWVHIDGAYGLFANSSPLLAPLFARIEEADSWIVDPHKWLATGLGVGATFVRNEAVLTRAFAEGESAYLEGSFSPASITAESQFDSIGGPWADQGVELSAPPRGVLVWAALLEIGRRGLRERVERHVGFARGLADIAKAHDELELMCEPDLSIVCFRFNPGGVHVDLDSLNTRVLERLRRETPFVPTSTLIDGAFVLRPCFINPRTTWAEVEGLADAVVRFGRELIGTPSRTAVTR